MRTRSLLRIAVKPHGGQFAMAEKLERLAQNEKPNPLIDPAGWHTTLVLAERAFRQQLDLEKTLQAK